ncbi:MAG TPA: galactose mutarotase [Candidatus Anaerofilum excrementigallinarum]|nr:galactose mutarotase [Candidatus Anaerofilum excrementigallinarum]
MVSKTYYGTTASGQKVHSFLLENRRGTRVSVIEYGCRITHLLVPDRSGRLTDVVLGCRDLEAYEKDDLFLGAFVGRVANRIEGAHFTLEGKEYQLEANNGPNHNHGVWHQRVFEGRALGPDTVEFIYHSPDGEDGFPGNVSVSVRYTLTEGNRLILDYTAAADAVTPINLTNHSYFNLDGAGSTSVLDHKLTVYAHQYTPADAVSCPDGRILPVEGTPMDFTTGHAIGRDIGADFQQLIWGNGYDHNYVIDREEPGLVRAARLESEKTGIWMECSTTQPGIQIYTGNYLQDADLAKPGFVHAPRAAVCLETQHFPCALSRPNFPSILLRPGRLLRENTVYAFGCAE